MLLHLVTWLTTLSLREEIANLYVEFAEDSTDDSLVNIQDKTVLMLLNGPMDSILVVKTGIQV